jgi:GDP-L-fucose synthase
MRIYIAGHRGMVGSAILRKLAQDPNVEIVKRNRNELDLTTQSAVESFFASYNIDQVYLAAAKVGGIYANSTYPADFIYQNLMIEANVINSAFKNGVKKLLFLGSNCIYPKFAEQPIGEDCLLTGPLECTNEPYALAKIAGIKLCESYNRQYGDSHHVDYRSVMPVNLYGPGDNYHSENAHVFPALLRRFHEAKIRNMPEVCVWGSGTPLREFLHVDDMASASIHVMNLNKDLYQQNTKPMLSHINVGFGNDITIAELAELISKAVGYKGKITFDSNMPDGTPRKLLDSSRLNSLGWQASISLEEGIASTYQDFLKAGTRLDG